MGLQRTGASSAVQAAQDTTPAPPSRRPVGTVIAVIQRTQAKVTALEGVATPVIADGRGLASITS